MPEECGLGEERMRLPRRGLDGVGASEREVVVTVLDIGFGEDAYGAELAGLSSTMSRGQHELRGDKGAGAAERWLPADIHHDEDGGGMGIPVEHAISDERRAIRGLMGSVETLSQPSGIR